VLGGGGADRGGWGEGGGTTSRSIRGVGREAVEGREEEGRVEEEGGEGEGVEEESTPSSPRTPNLFASGTVKVVGATGGERVFLGPTTAFLLTAGGAMSLVEVPADFMTGCTAFAYDRPGTGVTTGGQTVFRAS